MESSNIKELIEKYWKCETSIEEERYIRNFFSQSEVPMELKALQSMFCWQKEQADIRMEEQIIPTSSTKGIRKYFYPILQTAAAILIILICGIGIYTQTTENKKIEQSYSDTYSNPEDAMREAREALGKVSLTILQSQELILGNDVDTDSIPE